jgi:hypothetical protein
MSQNRKSPFPECMPTKVWRQIIRSLRSDPVLKRGVDTWQIWSGEEEDTAEPTESNLPLLRITSGNIQGQWNDENSHQYTWQIKIEIGVEGTDETHLLDFWDAIRAALFTGNTVLNALYPYGVIQKTITGAGAAPRMFGQQAGLASEGALTIKMRVDS